MTDLAENERIDSAVAFINGRAIQAGLDLACEVGQYILDEFFDGDYERFSSTRSDKPTGFTSLLRRDDLMIPPTTLYTFVRVSQQITEIPDKIARQLSVSHHRALLPLPDTETKVELAKKAVEKEWTKAELENAARGYTPRSPQGRKRLPAWAKAANRVSRSLGALEGEIKAEEVEQLGEERLRDLLRTISESRMRLEWLHASLQEALES